MRGAGFLETGLVSGLVDDCFELDGDMRCEVTALELGREAADLGGGDPEI